MAGIGTLRGLLPQCIVPLVSSRLPILDFGLMDEEDERMCEVALLQKGPCPAVTSLN